MHQNSTLKKLAETLDLSISTVSRALKNHPDISTATRIKVQELAAALEYEPNNFAVQLRNNASRVLGILVPSVDNFFYDSFIAAVEQEARLHQYSVLILQSGESSEAEIANLRIIKNNRVAGLFVSLTRETTDIQAFLKLQQMNTPVIFVDRVPDTDTCNKVCLADALAAKIAAEALVAANKQHVLALFGHPNLSISRKRLASFQQTFAAISPQTRLEIGYPFNREESKKITLNALKAPMRPDAIFCMSDLVLVGAMQAVYEMELIVPGDIGVITISNGFIPTIYNPPITYVETSGYKLGKLAFQRMVSCLSGYTFLQEVILDSVLVKGGSL